MDIASAPPATLHRRRRLLVGFLVLALVAGLTGCSPSAGVVESHTVALAARRVGVAVTSAQVECATDRAGTVLGSWVVEASCRLAGAACCVIPVTATYRDGAAAATASIDASMLSGRWWRGGGRWWVTCTWIEGPSGWTSTGCTTPTHDERT